MKPLDKRGTRLVLIIETDPRYRRLVNGIRVASVQGTNRFVIDLDVCRVGKKPDVDLPLHDPTRPPAERHLLKMTTSNQKQQLFRPSKTRYFEL